MEDDSDYEQASNDDDVESFTMDTGHINDNVNENDDDEDESFKSCVNEIGESSNATNIVNYPPEISDEEEILPGNNSRSRSSSLHSDTDSSSSSESSVSEHGGAMIYEDSHEDDEDDFSDPDNDAESDRTPQVTETSFTQRELLDYLGSLFNMSSNFRSRVMMDNQEESDVNNMSDEQLERYIEMRNEVNQRLKVYGVNSIGCRDCINSNLVRLMIYREMGRVGRCNMDWKMDDDVTTTSAEVDNTGDGDGSSSRAGNGKCVDEEVLDLAEEDWDGAEDCKWNEEMANGRVNNNREVQHGDDDDSDDEEDGGGGDNLEVVQPEIISVDLTSKNDVEASSSRVVRSSELVCGSDRLRLCRSIAEVIYASKWSVSRLSLEQIISTHSGCVNALNWSCSGRWIASGSDDRHINIVDVWNKKRLSRFTVGHSSNIFQVKFMPNSQDLQMVSCGRDGTLRLSQLSTTGQLEQTRLLSQHRDSCHNLDFPIDCPSLVLSAGEDGRVLGCDVRAPGAAPSKLRLCSSNTVPLYSLSCNPVRSQELAIAGKDSHVQVYDRRNSTLPIYRLVPSSLGDSSSGCPHLSPQMSASSRSQTVRSSSYYHITSICYSAQGNSLLASYNDDDIYLLHAGAGLTRDSTRVLHKYCGHRNVQTVTGVSFYGPSAEYIVSGSNDGHLLLWDRETEAIVNWVRADNGGVVNVLAPHPYYPMIATAGLDSNVKLWSMLGSDGKQPGSRGLAYEDGTYGDLLSRSADTLRISRAWDRIDSRLQRDSCATGQIVGAEEDRLPFKLKELQVVAALNWKMRNETYPYTFDNPLDNLIVLSRRRPSTATPADDDDDDAGGEIPPHNATGREDGAPGGRRDQSTNEEQSCRTS